MGKVIVLDEGTANKIAAGEVVERPSSVVKELAENSLDAGAQNVTVEIHKGGIASIKVSDDGEGFYEDDMPLAFERYATSKLRTSEDLDNILTYGFRGEALPSIAAVSKVRLVSRRRDAEYGRLLEIHAGRIVKDESAGCPFGTTITVSELFYNLPARYKFLKKDSAEAAQISELVGRLAVGRPDVSFTLKTQNTPVLHTQGGGRPEDAIFAVYGAEILSGLLPIRAEQAGQTEQAGRIGQAGQAGQAGQTGQALLLAQPAVRGVSGYIGRPDIARANRNYQLFYINGRLVKNRILYSAVEEAYKSFIFNKRYPVAVIYIDIAAPLVDVNAHPTKAEVRFFNEAEIFRAVYHAVKSALHNQGERYSMRGGVAAGESGGVAAGESGGRDVGGQSGITAEKAGTGMSGMSAGDAGVGSGGVAAGESGGRDVGGQSGVTSSTQEGINGIAPSGDVGLWRYTRYSGGSEPEQQAFSVRDFTAAAGETDYITATVGTDYITATVGTDYNAATVGTGNNAAIVGTVGVTAAGITGENTAGGIAVNYAAGGNDAAAIAEFADGAAAGGTDDIAAAGGTGNTSATAGIGGAGVRFAHARYIGQIFDTYIALERGDTLFLIDQHAVHERVIYERLRVMYLKNAVQRQMLLEAVTVSLLPDEMLFARESARFLEKAGFLFEEFGHDAIILRETPIYSERLDIKEFFLEVLETMRRNTALSMKTEETGARLDGVLYEIACKAAVKGNRKLSATEASELARALDSLPEPLTCPHGRPLVISMTKREFDKKFRRV